MVSLEDRVEYQKRVNNSPKLKYLSQFLLGKVLSIPDEVTFSETDNIYVGALESIQKGKRKDFEHFYSKKSKSNPTDEFQSPFVSDDFLIFSLIVGIVKFGIDKEWITRILSLRKRSSITSTFENLLTENYYSKSNQPEIIFSFLNIIDSSKVTTELLDSMYDSIKDNDSLFDGKNDFLTICSLHAYNELIKMRGGDETILLKSFKNKFLKRIKVLTWCVSTLVLFAVLMGLIKLLSFVPEIKVFLDDYDPFFGVLGLSLLGNTVTMFRKSVFNLLLKIFGFPVEILE